MFKKTIITLIITVMVFTGVINVANANSLSGAQISAIISLLQAFGANSSVVQNVEDVLYGRTSTTPPPTTNKWCYTFNNNLSVGANERDNKDLNALIRALELEEFQISNAGSGLGSIFNEYVASAVVGFQEKYSSEVLKPYGLSRGTGYVGQSTRAKLNKLYGCGTTQTADQSKISITYPLSGYNLENSGGKDSGIIATIQWKSENVGNNTISISLLNETGAYQIKSIVTGIPDTGYYNWAYDSSIPNGKYQIEVFVDSIKGGAKSLSGSFTLTNDNQTSQPVIAFFNASSTSISAGKQLNITWQVRNATRCVIQSGLGDEVTNLPINGTRAFYPSESTYYKLWCTNEPGNGKDGPSVEKKIYISVNSVIGNIPKITSTTGKALDNWEAYAGLPLTIMGENLLGGADTSYGTLVYINGLSCPITRASNTYLECTIPSTLQVGNTYGLYVKNSAGTSNKAQIKINGTNTQPSITVLSPNGGETYSTEDYIPLSWKSSELVESVSVYLVSSTGAYYLVSNNAPANAGGMNKDYSWKTENNILPGNYKLKVSINFTGKGSGDDSSDSYFTITSPTPSTKISVSIPATGGILAPNESGYSIVWEDTRLTTANTKGVEPVYWIGLYGSGKDIIADNVSSSTYCNGSICTYKWTTPNAGSSNNQIVVYDTANDPSALIVGRSGYFTIAMPVVAPSITVLSPNGGETYKTGETVLIKWNGPSSYSNSPYTQIGVYGPNGTGDFVGYIYGGSWISGGSYSWGGRICSGFSNNIPINCRDIDPGTYKIFVSIGDGTIRDLSDSYFTITSSTPSTNSSPALTVLSPNGGETWTKGTGQTVKWNQSFASSNVKVNIVNSVNKYVYSKIISGIQGLNSYNLSIEALDLPEGDYKLYICADYQTNQFICDSSDVYFKISDLTISWNFGTNMTANLLDALRLINPVLYK